MDKITLNGGPLDGVEMDLEESVARSSCAEIEIPREICLAHGVRPGPGLLDATRTASGNSRGESSAKSRSTRPTGARTARGSSPSRR